MTDREERGSEIETIVSIGLESLLTVDHRLAFCLAGHAIFTLRNSLTGNRFTYRIRAKNRQDSLFWVSVLAGPNNSDDYTYLGYIARQSNRLAFNPILKHRTAQSARAFAWAWPRIVAGTLPPEIEFHHAGRCGRCNRLLTTPESIASGIGPKCAELANR